MRSAGMLLATLVGTILYVGLALLGAGGPGVFLDHPPLLVIVAALVLMLLVAPWSRGNLSKGVREDRDNRWVIAAFTAIGLAHAWLPPFTDRIGLGTIDGEAVRWIGAVLYIAGGALRMAPVFVLGHRFSGLVAIQPGHTLATTGLYGTIRNPSYLGLLANAIGWSLAFRSLPGLLLAALLLPPLIARIHAEEHLLAEHFGAEYKAYRARTWRLVPGVW
jgi:protein-S-isoprenylcysteine O-methyltransferase Ste14